MFEDKLQDKLQGKPPMYSPSTQQVPDKYPTSTQQASSLIEAIGNNIYSVKELMGLMGLKDRENFLNSHLNSSIANGYIEPFILKVQSIQGRNIA